ncbi:uncharacterized protein K02A2.6-like [Saccostrea cucullata]|uniref:uncharacterized protein K02A2.6-like n=1 Tax=Saccostrea cuccullata TaxID=36930 RepID=UPI002ED15537
MVLDRLAEKGLTLNREKCEFGLSKIVFLGHVISSEGVKPDQEKIKAVSETRTPSNSSEIRGFLGLANYCGRFIPNFSTIAATLRELTMKNTHWSWTKTPGCNAADALSRLSQNQACRIRHIADVYAHFITDNAVPKALTIQEVRQKTSEDRELVEIMRRIKTGHGRLDPKIRTVEAELSVVDGIVLRGSRIILPKCLRRQTIQLAHEGHQGIVRTKQRLREKVWWPGIDTEAARFVRTCQQCQLSSNNTRPEPVRTTVLPDGPRQDLAIDLMGPFPSEEYLLVVVDYFSRFQKIAIMKKITSEKDHSST